MGAKTEGASGCAMIVLVGVLLVFTFTGIYQAFRFHSVGQGLMASFFPPVAWLRGYEFMRMLDDAYREVTSSSPTSPDTANTTVEDDLPPSLTAFFDSAELMSDGLNLMSMSLESGDPTPESMSEAFRLLSAGVQRSRQADREVLNSVYPNLGEAFHSYLVQGVTEAIAAIQPPIQQPKIMEAMVTVTAWQQWWSKNGSQVFQAIASKYELETR